MKSRTAASIGIGVSLLIVILTVTFDIFPYLVIGIITLFLAVMMFVDGVREYWRTSSRPPPLAPPSWDAVDQEQFPVTSKVEGDHAKQRLAESCELHGKHIPRTGAYGLIEHPLRLDE